MDFFAHESSRDIAEVAISIFSWFISMFYGVAQGTFSFCTRRHSAVAAVLMHFLLHAAGDTD
jgi:hypothetical protein